MFTNYKSRFRQIILKGRIKKVYDYSTVFCFCFLDFLIILNVRIYKYFHSLILKVWILHMDRTIQIYNL